MIKVSVFYPRVEGKKFDMEYYCNRHIPMVRAKLGDACKAINVESGLSGAEPGSPPLYAAIGHLCFESVPAFEAAFGPHAQTIMADIPNYTELSPTIQISTVWI
jgi:uncharacterized protein (TIGR02118 family)